MKWTQLKRSAKPIKRSPIRHRAKRYPMEQSEIDKVDERAGGRCEYCGARIDLQNAHIIHRKMGGAQAKNHKIINEHRNIAKLCWHCHDVLDRRFMVDDSIRCVMIATIKYKISWYEWQQEYGL